MDYTVSDEYYAGFKLLHLVMNDTVSDGHYSGYKMVATDE